MNKKISIITPTYNSENYIRKCVESVLNQNYDNIEYILIDGQSNDNTLKILREFKSKITLVSEKDGGNYDAIRKGFSIATGDVITWIDSDNYYENKNVIAKVMSEFNKIKNIDIVTTNIYFKYQFSNKKNLNKTPEKITARKLIDCGNKLTPEAVFYRKKLYDEVGGINTNYILLADYDLWIRLFRKFVKHKKLDFVSATYVIRKNALLRKNFLLSWKETFVIGKKYKRSYLNKVKFSLLFLFAIIKLCISKMVRRNGKNKIIYD
jgi:glycosyltransferase involved in cell wall biosynthesis